MWYQIYERDEQGRKGACVFDCNASDITDALLQVCHLNWPNGLFIRPENGEIREFVADAIPRVECQSY